MHTSRARSLSALPRCVGVVRLLRFLTHLLTVDRHIPGCFYTKLGMFATRVDDPHHELIADDDRFSHLARQDQHVSVSSLPCRQPKLGHTAVARAVPTRVTGLTIVCGSPA